MVEHATITQIMDMVGKNKVHPANLHIQQATTSSRSESPVFGDRRLVRFNVSGQVFLISQELLEKYPESRLASLERLKKHMSDELGAFYFDRDPALFNAILNVFRYDVVNIPAGYTEFMMKEELKFWSLPVSKIGGAVEDCNVCIEQNFLWMESRIPPPKEPASRFARIRYLVWCFISDPLNPHTKYRKLSIAFVLLNVFLTFLFMILYGLSTKPSFRRKISKSQQVNEIERVEFLYSNSTLEANYFYEETPSCDDDLKIMCFVESRALPWIQISLSVLMGLFVVDTLLRLLFCPDLKMYLKSVINWVDIACCLCVFALIPIVVIETASPPATSLAMVEVVLKGMQVLRIFKILQYSTLLDGLMVMILTLKASLNELLVLAAYLMMAMVLFSTLVTLVELMGKSGEGIPDSLIGYWWAIITMTTVGYGDYYPSTTLGYVVGVFCAITGLIMTALPVAVIGRNFNLYWDHNKERKKLLRAQLEQENHINVKHSGYCEIPA